MSMKYAGEGIKRGEYPLIPLDQLVVDEPTNTRFAPPTKDELDRMKEDLRVNGQRVEFIGLLLPDRRVKLIDGHQRFKLMGELLQETGDVAKFSVARVNVIRGNEEDAVRAGIALNLFHAKPTIMDNVKNWGVLTNQYKEAPADIAKLYGVSQATVTEGLKLLSLPKKIQMEIHTGKLPASAGIFLASKVRAEKYEEVLTEALRVAEERVAKVVTSPAPDPVESTVDDPPDPAEYTPTPEEAPVPEPTKQSPKRRELSRTTATDIVKAARNVNALQGDNPPRKLKEVRNFFQETADTETKGNPAHGLALAIVAYIDGQITDAQMTNRLVKYCIPPEPPTPKKGKK